MQRRIVAFRQDAEADWLAELACGHRRHTRHDPPWVERSWVLTEQGRGQRLGTSVDCEACERREIPPGYEPQRRTRTFTAESTPEALRSRHTTKSGVWARIHVNEGRLRYRIHEPFDEEQVLEAGSAGVVLPEVEHEVEPLGTVEFFIEFYRSAGPR